MAKNGNPKILKRFLVVILCLVLTYVVLGSFKSIYNNLHATPAVQMGLYNPNMDLIIAASSSLLLGFVIGYWLKSKR